MPDAGNSIIGAMNIGLACLSGYSVYVIFDDFVNVSEEISGAKQYMEQLSVLISVFYILILITTFYAAILFFKNSTGDGDPHHVLVLILNSFLFFYGFMSVIPAGIALVNGATTSVYAPIITSSLSIVLGAGVIIYYTSKGSNFYLKKDNLHHSDSKIDLQTQYK